MVSDDLTALAAISMGVMTSAAVTFALTTREEALPTSADLVTPIVSCTAPQHTIVDFAIVRSPAETMVGPEGSRSGWVPDRSLETGVRRRR